MLAVVLGMGLVIYGFGPYFHDREQRSLFGDYVVDIERAAAEATTPIGAEAPTTAPVTGDPVAILEIGALELQEVVVEGVGASQTRIGPGHVPGTAGPGQPGNSVIVGRRTAFGGPMAGLRTLDVGDEIVTSTIQGQSVYEVVSVDKVELEHSVLEPGELDSTVGGDVAGGNVAGGDVAGGDEGGEGEGTAEVEEVYGPSEDDRLTLVTSASPAPWNEQTAVIVVAELGNVPFAPTPQSGRTNEATGQQGDSGAASSVVLAAVLWGLVLGASVVLYRRLSPRTAYLLSVPPVMACTVIASETLSRAFPAWM